MLLSRWGLLVLYFCSGLVALSYQVLWARWLSTVFGVSIFGIAVTTVAFMIGLGAGSVAGRRGLARYVRPLFVFGVLEISIAFFALLLPPIQQALDAGLTQLSRGSDVGVWHALQALTAIALFSVPTFAMGYAFPMIVATAKTFRASLADVYGWNTVGAALGALLPLILLPGLGWRQSLVGIAFFGLIVGIAALALSHRTEKLQSFSAGSKGDDGGAPPLGSLIAYGVVGAAALLLEIAWIRLYGMVLLRTEYVMAIILSTYLIGIGVGSLLARHAIAAMVFSFLPVVAACFAVVSLWALPFVAQMADGSDFVTLDGALVNQGALVMIVTLPVTLIFGAWLPLLVQRSGDTVDSAALLYGVNCLGGATGALLAAFVLLPLIGSTGTIAFASLLLIAAGMYWVRQRWLWFALVAVIAAVLPVWTLPSPSLLMPSSLASTRTLSLHEDAVAITHVVEQDDGQRLLLSDLQRMDASTSPSAVIAQRNQVRLPLLLHADPRDVLLLGLGTGISASSALDFDGVNVTAVELAKGAIIAADAYFRSANNDVLDRINVYRDDARRFLKLSDQRFDVIVGDLFHPDFVGRSTLLSVQQFARARDHLRPEGVFVQWLAINQFDVESLKIVLRSFSRVFEVNGLFVDGFRVAMVGINGAHVDWAVRAKSLIARTDEQQRERASGGEGVWTWYGRYWGKIDVEPGAVQDEWWPQIEFRLPAARYQGAIDVKSVLGWLLEGRPRLQDVTAQWAVPAGESDEFERAYIASELAVRSWHNRLSGRQQESLRLLRLAYEANPRDRWIADQLADEMLLSVVSGATPGMSRREALAAVLAVAPDHPDALELMWRTLRDSGDEGSNALRERLQVIDPLRRIENAGLAMPKR